MIVLVQDIGAYREGDHGVGTEEFSGVEQAYETKDDAVQMDFYDGRVRLEPEAAIIEVRAE